MDLVGKLTQEGSGAVQGRKAPQAKYGNLSIDIYIYIMGVNVGVNVGTVDCQLSTEQDSLSYIILKQ